MKAPEKALMIQLRRVGDVLMCTPAIRAFKGHFSGCSLDFLTELPDVLQGNPNLESIIPVDRSRQYDPVYQFSLIRRLRKKRYDLVVDFFSNPRSAYYSFLSGAPLRLSYGLGHRKWAYNLTPAKKPEPVYAAADRTNLIESVGVRPDGNRLDFYPSEGDRQTAGELLRTQPGKPILTVSPVSRRAFNRWPIQRYADLCKELMRIFDFEVVILAGPGEENVARELKRNMTPLRPLTPTINRLGVLGAILEKATFHVGNDNGPKHIAVACGAPTFTIYGPHSHVSWTFPDHARHRYISPPDVAASCRALDHRCDEKCILKIPVEAVVEKVEPMIKEILSIHSSAKRP